jgi:arsenite methyltransferase
VHVVATAAIPLWHLPPLRHSAVTPDTLTDPSPDEAALLWSHHERLALDRHFKAGRALIERVGPQRGERVLELACGTGQLTEVLAQRVGPQGDVLGLDSMPLRVHLAHQQYTLRQLRFQIGDVGQLERFPDGVFDVVISNGALRPGPQGLSDLASLRRLLAPGGRLGVSVLATEPVHPAALVLAEVMRQPAFAAYRGASGAAKGALTAPGLATALQSAGFDAVEVDATSEESVFVHPEAALAHMQAQASEPFLGCLPVYLRAPARADIMRRLAALPRLNHKAVRLFGVAGVAGARP